MTQRVRVRYTKDGRVRFVSARDLVNVWARALRRSDLPIAYSEGFSPHPKVSFPDALPVGVASIGEYAELTFASPFDTTVGMEVLSSTLPDGMSILHHHIVIDGEPKLARLLETTLWEVVYPADGIADAQEVTSMLDVLIARLLAADHANITRTKPRDSGDETRVIDLRPIIVAMHATLRDDTGDAGPAPTLRAILSNDGPSVRSGDLHDILTAHAAPGDRPLPAPRILRRVVQGHVADGGLHEALSGEHIPLDPGIAPSRKRDERDRRDHHRAGGCCT